MTKSEFAQRLTTTALNNAASTFFLNGARGVGKSYLINQLADELPGYIPYCHTLGPFALSAEEVGGLGQEIVKSCRRAGFVDSLPADMANLSLTESWRWLAENAYFPKRQTFLIFIDIEEPQHFDLDSLGTLFSDARRLEGEWDRDEPQLLIVISGYWDHSVLRGYFADIRTSFPYTAAHNFMIWPGLSLNETVELVENSRQGETELLHGRLLHELTLGHAGAIVDVLANVPTGHLELSGLLKGTWKAVAEGGAGKRLVAAWRLLPEDALTVVRSLLLRRHAKINGHPPYLDQLDTAGLVRLERLGVTTYASFRSWYIELLVRLNAGPLGIADEQTQRIRIDELAPPVMELNVEAYRLVNDIENQARNFITIQLMTDDDTEPVLLHEIARNAVPTGYEDANRWRESRRGKGVAVEPNPLMSYLKTRDLARIVHRLANEMQSGAWREIARSIDELADVRDAVMHNQIIGDAELQRLYELQEAIYNTLSETQALSLRM